MRQRATTTMSRMRSPVIMIIPTLTSCTSQNLASFTTGRLGWGDSAEGLRCTRLGLNVGASLLAVGGVVHT